MSACACPRCGADGPLGRLTVRQQQVAMATCEGLKQEAIASQLGISAKTVEYHKSKVYAALQVHGTAELVLWAVKNGVVKV